MAESEGDLLGMRNRPDFLYEVGDTVGSFFEYFLKKQKNAAIFDWSSPGYIFRSSSKTGKNIKEEL